MSDLTPAERQFLTFALDLAADEMANCGDEFDDEDDAALVRLRQLTEEPPAAPCSAGLLPLGAKAVEPCITRGKHLMHRSASGESWPVEGDEE